MGVGLTSKRMRARGGAYAKRNGKREGKGGRNGGGGIQGE